MTAPLSEASQIFVIMRRLLKTSSDQSITDATLEDALNRFYLYDVPQNIQSFDLKRKYIFNTLPNVHIYDFPFNSYQMIKQPAYADGVSIAFFTQEKLFYNVFPEFVFNEATLLGDGTAGPYTPTLTRTPLLRGYLDQLGYRFPNVIISATDGTGTRHFIVDQGTLKTSDNIGFLYETTDYQLQGNTADPIGGTAQVNYTTGLLNFTFPQNIPSGNVIQIQTVNYSAGWPRAALFFDNFTKLYPVPDKSYKMEFDAYMTPAQFITEQDTKKTNVDFSYMGEYLAYGAALKILAEVGDTEQYHFYRGLFQEKEAQVLRKTMRIKETNRTPTIFSAQTTPSPNFYTQY